MVSGLSLVATRSHIEDRFGVTVPSSYEPADRIDLDGPVVVLEADSPGTATLTRLGVALEDETSVTAAVPAESLENRADFARAFDRNRVLVLVDGVELDGGWFDRVDASSFAVAGIRHPTGTDGGVAIVTIAATDFDPRRVPIVVPTDQIEIWLHYFHASELSSFITPPDPTAFRVGYRRNDAG